jgi:hypothetical protein
MKPKPSSNLLKLLELAPDEDCEDTIDPHFLQLQSKLCELVRSKKLHWRHEQMAYGMMLLLLVQNYLPPEEVVEMWLQALINHDRSMRLVAFQALEGILKVGVRYYHLRCNSPNAVYLKRFAKFIAKGPSSSIPGWPSLPMTRTSVLAAGEPHIAS